MIDVKIACKTKGAKKQGRKDFSIDVAAQGNGDDADFGYRYKADYDNVKPEQLAMISGISQGLLLDVPGKRNVKGTGNDVDIAYKGLSRDEHRAVQASQNKILEVLNVASGG